MCATNKKTTPKMQGFKLDKDLGKYFFLSFPQRKKKTVFFLECLRSCQDIGHIKMDC